MNALIIGVPQGFWRGDWKHNFINVLPMGVFAIANYCNGRGHRVRVGNAAVFPDRESALREMLARIRKDDVRVVGLPMHWHLAGYDVLETANFIKQAAPQVRVVLGGLTASVYAAAIVEAWPTVDGVISGDGEVPFCRFLDTMDRPGEPDFSEVPNLTWRKKASVEDNGISYVAGSEELSQLDFSPQDSICSMAEYANGMRLADAVEGAGFAQQPQPVENKWFFMNIGRGCTLNCVFCGGCQLAYLRYSGRTRLAVRSPESVLADFERCHAAGFRRFHIAFDPPFRHKEDYFQELFALVRNRFDRKLDLLFEVYGLPSRAFLEAASRTFAWTGIILSPCIFDPETRQVFKGYSFSDEAMAEILAEIPSYPNCHAFVYYALTRLEEWTEAAADQRIEHMKSLRERYGCEVSVLPIYAEPGSPWVSFPGFFPNRNFQLKLPDFLAEWQHSSGRWSDRLTGVEGSGTVMKRMQAALDAEEIAV